MIGQLYNRGSMKKNLLLGSLCLTIFLLVGLFAHSIHTIYRVNAQEEAILPATGEEGDNGRGGERGGDEGGELEGVDAGDTDQQQVSGYRQMNGYAWSSNIGWVKFSGTAGNGQEYKVLVDAQSGNMSGYAWSSNLGWLSFNSSDTSGCGTNAKYNRTGTSGTITGYAVFLSGKNRTDGWNGCLKFNGIATNGNTYSVTATENGTQARLAGSAWGNNVVGWTKMCGSSYCVTIDDVVGNPTCLPPSTPITTGPNAGRCQCPLPGGSIVNPGETCPDYSTPLTAPTLNAQPGLSCGQISLTWNAITGADHYILYGKPSGAGSYSVVSLNIYTTQYLVTDLTGSYTYKVRAVNAIGGLGTESNEATATASTQACVPPPDASIGTFVSSPSSVRKNNACTLTWTGVTGNDSCTIYKGSLSGEAVYTLPLNGSGHPADGSHIIDPSLQATTRYILRCRDDAQGYDSDYAEKETQCSLAPSTIEI